MEQVSKRRKPRKDKGITKTSVLDSLGRTATLQEDFMFYGHQDNELELADPNAAMDENAEAFLSGSMTMCGNEIYHYDNSYHYPSGEYPTSYAPADESQTVNGGDRMDGLLTTGEAVDDDFFGTFEEHIGDPLLFT
jgi:hypothetical protein